MAPAPSLTGKCLDDLGFSTENSTQPGIWDCNGLPDQKWVLTP
ncbi:RICIN domain-containing protein [Streptomyces sp. NPDC052396]